MPPKNHGKNVMFADKAPAELPEDLPHGCKYNFDWGDPKINKVVLLKTTSQGIWSGYCWTIVFNRLIATHLFLHNKVGKLLAFSEKHLFTHIDEKFENGNLKNYRGVKTFLKDSGLVLEEECKCTAGKEKNDKTACEKVKDKMVFKIMELVMVEGKNVNETELISLLKTKGPIAVEIRVSATYKSSVKDEIYLGCKENSGVKNHIVLLTAIGTRDGMHYFKFQNSWGLKWGGDDGYGKFARQISLPTGSPSLIMNYFYPKLLDQVFEV